MVGRPERALEHDGSPLVQLATDLRELRRTAGSPSYRSMAVRVHRSQTTLSEAAGGERVPTWDTLEAYVTACGGTPGEWRERWEAASGRSAQPVVGPVQVPAEEPAEVPAQVPAQVPLAEPDGGRDAGAGGVPVAVRAARPRWVWPSVAVACTLVGLGAGYLVGAGSSGLGESSATASTVSVRDGSDPEDTGCARLPGVAELDTTEVDLDGRPVGLAQLKYSPGCGAAWPRFEPFTDDAVPAGVVVHVDVVRPAAGGEPEERFPFQAEHVLDQPTFVNLANSTSGCVYAAVRLQTATGETVESRTHCFRGATYVR